MEPPSSLRVDKWLWAARFFKTRSLAAAACAGGKVDVNDGAAKPARLVRVGDLLRLTQGGDKRILKGQPLADTRGPAPVARALSGRPTPTAPVTLSPQERHRMQPGAFFGEMSLLDGEPRSATVKAETDLRLLVIDRTHFWRLLKEVPGLTEKILVTLSRRVRQVEEPRGT